ncbi:MAG: phosphotransferase [Acidobacteria bacterium]|nr:phosphotransferase [Acidobacteriota bacterium]MCA1636944.1 phosphotransferase [Acidobacteriota bacterium]
MINARQSLEKFLAAQNKPIKIEPLTPDASIREYFRICWNDSTAIACVYPEPFLPKEQTYLDVTNLFLVSGLPVAKIYDFDGELGVIIQEDFGDSILRDCLAKANFREKEKLINRAIILIAKIQTATTKAFESNSIASRLKFDEEKLLWELQFFKTHYFETFRKEKLSRIDYENLIEEFIELSRELETRAKVLCHRDFHAANLMLDKVNRLRIIDHQDARIGAASYDLVSFLLDRIIEPPEPKWLNEKKRFFLFERERLGLEKIAFEDFDYEFDLMTVQRCLKAIGTFSFQSVNRGKIHFIQYIEPMFRIILEACKRLQRFPNLQKIIKAGLNKYE